MSPTRPDPIDALIERLRAAQVRLWIEGGQLRYAAPQGVLTPEILAEMRSRKPELLAFLERAQGAGATPALAIQPVPRTGAMPVSVAQQRLWFLHHLDRQGPTYNVPKAMRLAGRLDAAALERAFADVIERHEALRTSFDTVRGEPVQIVHAHVPFTLRESDLRPVAPDTRIADASAIVAGEVRQPFDLSAAPLIRARLLRLTDDDHVLVVVLHHIAADGRSLEVLFGELAVAYGARASGQAPPLAPLPIQYADYAAFERTWLATPIMAEKAEWWRTQLADAPARLHLPADHPRPPVQTFAGELEQFAIPAALTRALRDVAAAQGASLYMAVQAALAALFARFSAQDDICIGSPVENRPFQETEGLIGAFINTVVLRIDASGDPSFAELVARVRATALEAYDRQEVPFERLVELLQPDRSLAASPIFQVAVSWLNASRGFLALPGVDATPFDFPFRSVKFDLNLEIYETPGDLHVAWFYNTALFEAATIRRMIAHFLRLLETAAAAPDVPMASLDLLPAAEREQLEAWSASAPAADAAGTIMEAFARQCVATPDATAIVDGARSVTYSGLQAHAGRIARRLSEAGVSRGAIVALRLDNSIELVAAMLGVLKCGAAYLPLDPRVPDERLAFMLADASVQAGIGGPYPPSAVPPGFTLVDPADAPGDPVLTPAAGAHASDLAYVIYTSGSTGTPKGVAVEHGSLLGYLAWARDTYARGGPADFPLFTSAAFDLTVTSLFVPLLTGGRVVVYKEDPQMPAIFRVVRDQSVDVVKLTPAHLAMIRDLDLSAGRIRTLVLGGEDLKADACRRVLDALGGALEIFNEYGPTEATVGCMIHRFDPAADTAASVPIGRPAAGARIRLLDRHRRLVPVGAPGEIHIGGPGVARGYLHPPALTAERFVTDPFAPGERLYRSGDLGRWRPDGVMEYLGRADHQVKIRGHRVELDEIASALAADERVADCVVDAIDRSAVLATPAGAADVRLCARCGLASDYPGTVIDADGLCNTCVAFETHRDKVAGYFKTPADLEALLAGARARAAGPYDCLVLVSGGKDSVYMMARLKEMGARILAYTLDPGYLSDEAKANIRRVTAMLGIDHVFGGTPHMNEIFVDSLKRHANVCNGCFKTLYTLSMKVAHERGIPLIFTGLSRGQFFETRLSKFYNAPAFDVAHIDRTILDARKVYHRLDDVIAKRLDVTFLRDDRVFEQIEIADFYRYMDVSLTAMYEYLHRIGWQRPADTGRSTNCLINDVGIFIHKKTRGYHNYALPYSWDVRMAHKTRDEAVEELQDEIDEARVRSILSEIGWQDDGARERPSEKALVAYYVPAGGVDEAALRARLAQRLPEAMIPSFFVPLDRLPLTRHGKVDRRALPAPRAAAGQGTDDRVAPRTDIERRIASAWAAALGFDGFGIHDNFFALGGHSLMATRIAARLADDLGADIPLAILFDKPTIAELAAAVPAQGPGTLEDILAQVEGLTDAQARAQLQS